MACIDIQKRLPHMYKLFLAHFSGLVHHSTGFLDKTWMRRLMPHSSSVCTGPVLPGDLTGFRYYPSKSKCREAQPHGINEVCILQEFTDIIPWI